MLRLMAVWATHQKKEKKKKKEGYRKLSIYFESHYLYFLLHKIVKKSLKNQKINF